MPFQGFEGPAGTGKTHRLIESVVARLRDQPMREHQRVLALTFMHASRRRLEQRFSTEAPLRGRYGCMTIDSFALQVAHRWRSLAARLNAHVGDFNQNCNACGRLLEEQQIAKWVAAAFPIVVVDEAQELGVERLRVVQALAPQLALLVAADEFQCLDDNIDTAPFMAWFRGGRITPLVHVHRTAQQGLLDAATALRNAAAIADGPGLQIRYEFPNQMRFAIGHELHRAIRARGTIALVVAPGSRPWADALIPELTQGFRTPRQVVAPMRIGWEDRPNDEIDRVLANFNGDEPISIEAVIQAFASLAPPPRWARQCASALIHQRRVKAQEHWSLEALRDLMGRKAALHRAHGYHHQSGIPVMTISGAKNRQFRHVVVLWGPGVPGDADHHRRLLYNAITRAEVQCTVFVRTQAAQAAPPFRAAAG